MSELGKLYDWCLVWCDCDLSNIIIIDWRLHHHHWTGVRSCKCSPAHHRSRYMFGTHQIFTLIWVCGVCLTVPVCRVEFPHISQFLLMLALRVRLAALELTSLVTHGIILPSSLLLPIIAHRGRSWSIFRRETGARCDSHHFWWQVSLAGFVLSAADSLINLSRVVTRCAPAQSVSRPRSSKIKRGSCIEAPGGLGEQGTCLVRYESRDSIKVTTISSSSNPH